MPQWHPAPETSPVQAFRGVKDITGGADAVRSKLLCNVYGSIRKHWRWGKRLLALHQAPMRQNHFSGKLTILYSISCQKRCFYMKNMSMEFLLWNICITTMDMIHYSRLLNRKIKTPCGILISLNQMRRNM